MGGGPAGLRPQAPPGLRLAAAQGPARSGAASRRARRATGSRSPTRRGRRTVRAARRAGPRGARAAAMPRLRPRSSAGRSSCGADPPSPTSATRSSPGRSRAARGTADARPGRPARGGPSPRAACRGPCRAPRSARRGPDRRADRRHTMLAALPHVGCAEALAIFDTVRRRARRASWVRSRGRSWRASRPHRQRRPGARRRGLPSHPGRGCPAPPTRSSGAWHELTELRGLLEPTGRPAGVADGRRRQRQEPPRARARTGAGGAFANGAVLVELASLRDPARPADDRAGASTSTRAPTRWQRCRRGSRDARCFWSSTTSSTCGRGARASCGSSRPRTPRDHRDDPRRPPRLGRARLPGRAARRGRRRCAVRGTGAAARPILRARRRQRPTVDPHLSGGSTGCRCRSSSRRPASGRSACGRSTRRLASRLTMLTGGPRDLPARQQTLRETLAWSVNLLEPQAPRSLAALAVFPARLLARVRSGRRGCG